VPFYYIVLVDKEINKGI